MKWNSHRLHVYWKGPPIGVGWVMQGWGGSYRGWVGHAGKGWFIQGWGGSWRGGVGHAGVGWVMLGWGGVGMGWAHRGGVGHAGWGQVGHAGVGSGGSYRGGLGWVMKNIKILKILNYWCYRVSNPANQNPICTGYWIS